LRNVRHQIARDAYWIFANKTRRVSTHGIEIAQANDAPLLQYSHRNTKEEDEDDDDIKLFHHAGEKKKKKKKCLDLSPSSLRHHSIYL